MVVGQFEVGLGGEDEEEGGHHDAYHKAKEALLGKQVANSHFSLFLSLFSRASLMNLTNRKEISFEV